MSRSRRHSPVVTDQQYSRSAWYWKRLAARVARRAELADGMAYRRVFNPWQICDYKSALWGRGNRQWVGWDRADRRWWAK